MTNNEHSIKKERNNLGIITAHTSGCARNHQLSDTSVYPVTKFIERIQKIRRGADGTLMTLWTTTHPHLRIKLYSTQNISKFK